MSRKGERGKNAKLPPEFDGLSKKVRSRARRDPAFRQSVLLARQQIQILEASGMSQEEIMERMAEMYSDEGGPQQESSE